MGEPDKTLKERLSSLDRDLDRLERSQQKPSLPEQVAKEPPAPLSDKQLTARRILAWIVGGWSALVCLLILLNDEDLSPLSALVIIAFCACVAALIYGIYLYQWALAVQLWGRLRGAKTPESDE